jgi:hypothetical protein
MRKFIPPPPPSDENYNENCIRDFLGEEIFNSQLVQESRIPETLARDFERNLSIDELDTSAMQGNNSAAGMDGIHNAFIKKYWILLRKPLLMYSNAATLKVDSQLTSELRQSN